MSTKTEIVDCGASYCKVFSTIFCRMSFSTATPIALIMALPLDTWVERPGYKSWLPVCASSGNSSATLRRFLRSDWVSPGGFRLKFNRHVFDLSCKRERQFVSEVDGRANILADVQSFSQ